MPEVLLRVSRTKMAQCNVLFLAQAVISEKKGSSACYKAKVLKCVSRSGSALRLGLLSTDAQSETEKLLLHVFFYMSIFYKMNLLI